MTHPKLRKELIIGISFTTVYLLMNIFQYHLDKFATGIPIHFLTNVILFVLIIFFGVDIFKIYRRRKKLKGRSKLKFPFYLPAIIALFGILYTFSPYKLNSEKLEGQVILRGCYESNTNKAVIRFRTNKTFEIKWSGEAGYADWFTGTYSQHKDTFFLIYFDKYPDKFGSIILNTGQILLSLDKPHLLENYYVPFYLGECKGLNSN